MRLPKDRVLLAVALYLDGKPVKEVLHTAKIGKDSLYRALEERQIPGRERHRGRPRKERPVDYTMTDVRGGERRDCCHYYGDGGCLDMAARKDLRAVPCRGCGLFDAGDAIITSQHH